MTPDQVKLIIAALIAAGPILWFLYLVYAYFGWIIGPMVKGKNYSQGLPLRPERVGSGWRFTLEPGDQVDGVTRNCWGLPPSAIRLRFRVSGDPATRLQAYEFPDRPASLTVFFQRRFDNWSGRGDYETYRWYTRKLYPLVLEEDLIVEVPLTPEHWKAVQSTRGDQAPDKFNEAREKAWRVGVVFGTAGGRSHGVITDKPVRFELLEWEVV